MDWLSIGVIFLAVVLLIVMQSLTGAASRPNCRMKPNVAKGGQLKNEILWDASSEKENSDKVE